MIKEELEKLREISCAHPSDMGYLLRSYLETVKITQKVEGNYTEPQRNSAWLYMTMKTEQLNESGLEMRKLLKPTYSIPWTKDSFHDHIWIPLQKALYGTDSMRSLKKLQVSKIHEIIEREINEKHGTEYIPFPSDDKKQTENLAGVRVAQHNNLSNQDYPEMTEELKANKL